jgi:hypothetical protein
VDRGWWCVVEHRHEQDLAGDLRAAALAGEDRQSRGHAAARAVTHHADPVGVDAEFRGMCVQPAQGGVGVLERGREGVLEGAAVLD